MGYSYDKLISFFNVKNLKGFGVEEEKDETEKKTRRRNVLVASTTCVLRRRPPLGAIDAPAAPRVDGVAAAAGRRHRRDRDSRHATRSERPQIRKRDHPRPPLPETIHEDGVRAPETDLLLLHIVPFVAELVVRLRVPQIAAAAAPGLASLR